MRVLHIGKFFAPFAGGIENFMLDLLPACADLGVEQALLVHVSPDGSGAPDAQFKFLSRFCRVPMLGQFSYAPISPAFRRALVEMITDFRPDILHMHLPNTSAFWALASVEARRLPWVVHWHSDVVGPGLDPKLKALYPFYRPFEQALLKRASAIIATSPPYLESSAALAPWQDKCRVIPLGIDSERVDAQIENPEIWSGDKRLRVLAVGRLTRYKGFDVLIRAAALVDGVQVVIAGEGEQRARLERLVREQCRRSNACDVRLIGGVADPVRNALLKSCDVLCLPSVNRAEAFGLSLVEAMAAGKPAIATRVPGSGMGWVVEHERTGWLVEPRNVGQLADVLGCLVHDRKIIATMGRNARARFEAQLRIGAVARQAVDLYNTLA
jgi:glycosyltransferase involved in cell wall biosynthesis